MLTLITGIIGAGEAMSWQVITVARGFERDVQRDALASLGRAGIDDADLSVPIEYRMRSDRKILIRVVLLPGYVFLRSASEDALGVVLRSRDPESGLSHVTGFLHRVGDRLSPALISETAMGLFFEIIDRANLEFVSKILDSKLPKRLSAVRYQHPEQGSFVKIIEGLTGEIVKTEKSKSVVVMQILGRLVEASVSTYQPLEIVT